MNEYDVIVVGAGLAGLTSAFELSERGKHVLVLESREVIGGRTSSWIERGMSVESGLHRFLGVYTKLPELLERAGIDLTTMLFWEDEIEIITPNNGPRGVLGAAPVHKPLKTVAGLIGNNDLLAPQDLLSLTGFFTSGLKDYSEKPEELDTVSVLEYAKKHKVTKNAINHLLIPLTAGIFFLPPERFSMYVLMGLIAP